MEPSSVVVPTDEDGDWDIGEEFSAIVRLDNVGNRTAVFDPIHPSDFPGLPFEVHLFSDGLLPPIENGASAVVRLTLRPREAGEAEQAKGCAAFALALPFVYRVDEAEYVADAQLLLRKDRYAGARLRLCQATPLEGLSARPAVETRRRARLGCECVGRAEAQCRRRHSPAAACGALFQPLAASDAFPGLAYIVKLVELAVGCKELGIRLQSAHQAVDCAVGLPRTCPAANLAPVPGPRARRVARAVMAPADRKSKEELRPVVKLSAHLVQSPQLLQRQPPAQPPPPAEIDSGKQPRALFQPSGPSRNEVLGEFGRFFGLLGDVVPLGAVWTAAEGWASDFRYAIGEAGDAGHRLSQAEYLQITKDLTPGSGVGDFLGLWNDTVDAWQSGNAVPSRAGDFVDVEDLGALLSSARTLDDYARRRGQPDPLALLDAEMEGLEPDDGQKSNEDCAEASVQVSPSEVEEGESFVLRLTIRNLSPIESLKSVRLSPPRSSGFDALSLQTVNVPKLSGIATVEGFSNLAANGTLMAEWAVYTSQGSRPLLRPAHLDLVVQFTFNRGDEQISQLIHSQGVLVKPRASLKLFKLLRRSPEAPVPYAMAVALANPSPAAARDLTLRDLRPAVTTLAGARTGFRVEAVEYLEEGRVQEAEATLEQTVEEVPSGSLVQLRYSLASTEPLVVQDLSLGLTSRDRIASLADERTFAVFYESADGALVLLGAVGETRPDHAMSNGNGNLSPLRLLRQLEDLPAAEDQRGGQTVWSLRGRFAQPQDASPGSQALSFAEMALPSNVPADARPVRVRRLTAGRPAVDLALSRAWLEDGRVKVLDDGLPGSPGEVVTYEVLFGAEGANGSPPRFTRTENRNLVAGTLTYITSIEQTTEPGSEVIALPAEDDSAASTVTYALYGDGTFSVNRQTGAVRLEGSPTKSRYCVTVVATDDGLPPLSAKVALQVIVSGLPSEENPAFCTVLPDTSGLQAYTHRTGDPLRPPRPETGTTAPPSVDPNDPFATRPPVTEGPSVGQSSQGPDPVPPTGPDGSGLGGPFDVDANKLTEEALNKLACDKKDEAGNDVWGILCEIAEIKP